MDKESDDTVLMLKACEQAEDKFNTTENTSNCIPVVLDNDKTKETNKLCSSSTLDKIDIKEKYTVLKVKHDTNKETLRKLKLVKHHKKKVNLILKKYMISEIFYKSNNLIIVYISNVSIENKLYKNFSLETVVKFWVENH